MKKPDIKETLEELSIMLHKERNAELKMRIHMLVLLKNGECRNRKEIAYRLAVHRNTIRNWLSIYMSNGLSQLLEIKAVGPARGQKTLDNSVLSSLKERLEDTSGFGSYIQIQSWIKETYGIEVKYKTLHKIVRYGLKAKLKIPRKSHIKKNESDVKAFKEDFPCQLKSVKETTEATESESNLVRVYDSIRVFSHDESRFGLMPITRRRITLEGVKPIQPFQIKFENYYLYGAIEPLTGEGFFLEMPRLDSICFQVYIDELSSCYIKDLILLIIDNSSTHKAKRLKIPENVKLLFIPPYSPELNPIERFWQYIKDHITFSLIEDLDTLKQEVSDILNKCTDSIIASLTGYSYIINAINAQLI
jgi:transposase